MNQRPARFGDVEYYPGDPLTIAFFFHAASGETAIDVSNCEFSIRCFTEQEEVAVPELDLSDAVAGFVRVPFTEAATEVFPRYVRVTVHESLQWKRTILSGRLTRSTLIGGNLAVEPVLEDQTEIVVRVSVLESAVPSGVDWPGLGEIMWTNLGDITWENI